MNSMDKFEEMKEDRPAINRQYIINYFKNAHTIHHEHKAYSKLPPCEFDLSTLFKFEDGSYYCTNALNVDASSDVLMYDKESSKLADIISYKDKECLEDDQTPAHYNNDKGSLYKIAEERGWNAYQFDAIKRIDRVNKKGNFVDDIKKTIFVLELMLNNK